MLAFGWDVSTSIVGVSCVKDGNFVIKDHIDLRKIDDLYDKAQKVKDYIRENNEEWGMMESSHFVEDRLGGFTRGMTSQQTLMRLAAFNAIISYILVEETGVKPVHIHPSTVKSILKKEGLVIEKGQDKKALTLAWARSREPSWTVDLNRNGKEQPWNFDEADAYAIAIAGCIRNPS